MRAEVQWLRRRTESLVIAHVPLGACAKRLGRNVRGRGDIRGGSSFMPNVKRSFLEALEGPCRPDIVSGKLSDGTELLNEL